MDKASRNMKRGVEPAAQRRKDCLKRETSTDKEGMVTLFVDAVLRMGARANQWWQVVTQKWLVGKNEEHISKETVARKKVKLRSPKVKRNASYRRRVAYLQQKTQGMPQLDREGMEEKIKALSAQAEDLSSNQLKQSIAELHEEIDERQGRAAEYCEGLDNEEKLAKCISGK